MNELPDEISPILGHIVESFNSEWDDRGWEAAIVATPEEGSIETYSIRFDCLETPPGMDEFLQYPANMKRKGWETPPGFDEWISAPKPAEWSDWQKFHRKEFQHVRGVAERYLFDCGLSSNSITITQTLVSRYHAKYARDPFKFDSSFELKVQMPGCRVQYPKYFSGENRSVN